MTLYDNTNINVKVSYQLRLSLHFVTVILYFIDSSVFVIKISINMMRHQYWVTKKTVLKKLGTKEDECIIASDAELDAKLELFRSISDSCLQLQRVLDQYQERLCILAQEENVLGKFLRDSGKNSDASGKHMVSAGKAISYSGQQRLSVRSPLLRLYHEVETFRGRAVSDMRATVSAMEKARIEYRAALSWMKSASTELDPDTGRGVDNFRKAQRQVRESKKLFDKLTLDVLQKVVNLGQYLTPTHLILLSVQLLIMQIN